MLRIPGVIDPQHTTTSQLEPATRMAPLLTRTCGIAYSALEAEDTITEIITRLPQQQPDTDPQVAADLAELSAALAAWSGTKPEWVLHHLRHRAGEIRPLPDGLSPAARRAAASFPNDIAALLAGEQPAAAPPRHPEPPETHPRPRLR